MCDLIASSNIYEYDIRKANISVLYDAGVISKETFEYLKNAKRMDRQVYIGKMQKEDPFVTQVLQKGIKTARDIFIKHNNIQPHNIIRISNDALYTSGVEITFTKISDNVEFIMKNKFTSYLKIFNYEIFYYFNSIADYESYKILGIHGIEIHHDNFIQLILTILNMIEKFGIESGVECVCDFIYAYENKQLPIEFYREFNSDHMFKISNGYLVTNVLESEKSSIDGEYNLSLLYAIKNTLLRQII